MNNLLIGLGLALVLWLIWQSIRERQRFAQACANFQVKTAREAASLLDSQAAKVFIGRSTCPYCRLFAPKLAAAQAATGARVYFVDSSNVADPDLQAFRDRFGVATVPGLLVSKGRSTKVVCDSSLSVEDIKGLIG